MTSIAKRPDGAHRAPYRDTAGVEHSKHCARKQDAQRWLDEQTAAIVTGQYASPKAGRVTFRECAEAQRQGAPHGPATRDKVRRALEQHAYPTFGATPMRAIRSSAVQSWVSGLPLAPATAKVVLGYVSAVFRSAVRDRIIPTSPCEAVRAPAARSKPAWIPDLATVEQLGAALPPRFQGVVDLVIGSGLRAGEVFGLELNGLDMRGRAVDVHQQLVCLSPQVYVGPVKTAESERIVPLAQVTLDALAAHLAAFPARDVEISDRTDPRNPVSRVARLAFTTATGSPVTRSQWSQIWRPAARAVGIPGGTGLHVLRHCYASVLIAHGESVKVVQKRLGHSSAVVTLGVYSHLWPNSDDRTREAVEAALGGCFADSVRTEERSS